MRILITGTSSGIGAEILKKLSLDGNTIACGNRTVKSPIDVKLDMASQQSIRDFVLQFTEQFDIIILNAGTKYTKKRVEWNGKQINICRVVNLLANDYLLEQMSLHQLINKTSKIVFMTSITHWHAVDNPLECHENDDPTDETWANQQYPNTKLGLFFLGRKMKKLNKNYDIILVNPGMVATKIFGDNEKNGLIPSSIRYIRELLSFTPSESAQYIVESILTEPTDKSKEFRYFTPYQTHPLFEFCDSTQMLQDVFGRRLLYRTNTESDNFSKRVFDMRVESNYMKYLNCK